jgi:uncharacterized protein (TIGR03435 family)
MSLGQQLRRHDYAASFPDGRGTFEQIPEVYSSLGTRCERSCCFFYDLPTHLPVHMLKAMLALLFLVCLALSGSVAAGQASPTAPAFDVASVKTSQHVVGPDYNNQLTYSPTGITGRNVTLQRLVAEAYRLQLNQVLGPSWLDKGEYDIDAKAAGAVTREQLARMLRSLVGERFRLTQHSEMREMRVYELVIGKSGPKIRPMSDRETATAPAGFHFQGDLRQFADLLTVQLSIPASENPGEPARASTSPISVLDKTGLPGIFDFSVDIHPELGTDMFTSWQRALEDQLGLRIESRKENVAVLVVDQAARIPTEN